MTTDSIVASLVDTAANPAARDPQSAQDLIASEKQYRRLFESAKDGILILDGDSGSVIDVNPFLLQLTGYARADFLGKQLWELGLIKDIAANKAAFATLQAQEYVRHEDLPLEGRDGRRVDVEFVSNVYWVDQRRIIQCNIRDITDRKRAEAEHLRLVTAVEQLAEMVLVTDANGTILFVNPAFEEVTGYSRAEVLGQNPRLLKSGKQGEAFYKDLWSTISSGGAFHGRMSNRRKDGTLFIEDATISPVRNRDGVISSYVAVKRDVSRELALEAQLLQSQKMEAIGQLAAGISHDFNNLLVVIITFSDLLLDSLSAGDPIRADLEEIRKAGQRAAKLTRQLLAFSRQQVIDLKPVNLNEVVTNMHRMFERVIGEDIEVSTVATETLGPISADVAQMEQVLMNLAVNARDAMPKGGRLTIATSNVFVDEAYASEHIGLMGRGPHVLLSVSDTGSGMSKETASHVFEPFYTTKEQGKGTGLGLSTVFGVIKQLGGTILVHSEPGLGTAFQMFFPRCDAAAIYKSTAPPVAAGGHEIILLVDDEPAVQNAAHRILSRDGYRVLLANSASEALRLCRSHTGKIDLLLTDVVMPSVSGPALAELLLAMYPGLRVLFMSGYTDEVVSRRLSGLGAAFLQKPFTPDVLSKRVRAVLDAPVAEGLEEPVQGALAGLADTGSGPPPGELDSLGGTTTDSEAASTWIRTRSLVGSSVARGVLSGRVLIVDTPEWQDAHLRVLEAAGLQVDVVSVAASIPEKVKAGYDVVITDIAKRGLEDVTLVRAIHQFDPEVAVIVITAPSDIETARKMTEVGAFKFLFTPVSPAKLLGAVQDALQLRRVTRLTGTALDRFGDRTTDVGNELARRGGTRH